MILPLREVIFAEIRYLSALAKKKQTNRKLRISADLVRDRTDMRVLELGNIRYAAEAERTQPITRLLPDAARGFRRPLLPESREVRLAERALALQPLGIGNGVARQGFRHGGHAHGQHAPDQGFDAA